MSVVALPDRPTLESIPGIWRGHRARALAPSETTGSKLLDEALSGGWPQGALSQIVSRYKGFGFSLIVPMLARLTQAGQHVALVNTPYQPYAPALDSRGIDLERLLWVRPDEEEQALWAVEQLLHSGMMAAVVFWARQDLDGNTERRLQLAAEASHCVALAFRSGEAEGQSYAAAKLTAAPARDGQIAIHVIKCRGGRAGRRILQPYLHSRLGRSAP